MLGPSRSTPDWTCRVIAAASSDPMPGEMGPQRAVVELPCRCAPDMMFRKSDGLAAGRVAQAWHACGMSRTRLSTTVDAELLHGARSIRSGITDATLIDEALRALLARHRAAEVDASYAAYDEHPIDEPDEWGDLASFRRAAAAS